MNYSQIIKMDIANGKGFRLSLFVSGCRHHCKGCFQSQTWDFKYGQEFTDKTLMYILKELSKPQYDGITILGGEPFEPENQRVVSRITSVIKSQLPNKTIWIYTGCIYEDLLNPNSSYRTQYTDKILHHTDILVDGPFIEEQKNITLKFRGSENQRIINLKEKKQ